MISEEHQLALHILRIRREETLFNQRRLTDEPFETHWLREATSLIGKFKTKWENKAISDHRKIKPQFKHQ